MRQIWIEGVRSINKEELREFWDFLCFVWSRQPLHGMHLILPAAGILALAVAVPLITRRLTLVRILTVTQISDTLSFKRPQTFRVRKHYRHYEAQNRNMPVYFRTENLQHEEKEVKETLQYLWDHYGASAESVSRKDQPLHRWLVHSMVQG